MAAVHLCGINNFLCSNSMSPISRMSKESRPESIVPQQGMGLYVHVPFCATKCPYCDFNTYQGIESLLEPYLEALTAELQLWGQVLSDPRVNTVFLGGGTPSYLPDHHLPKIFQVIDSSFQLHEDAEITVEANPDDLNSSKCAEWLRLGVNRLSVGIQSMDDGLLKLLGRRHDSAQAVGAVKAAQDGGFTNINLDLMYGLPGQSMAQWQDTLQRVMSLGPKHLSLYALTPEEGTPLHQWLKEGSVPQPDSDLAADMYQFAREHLAEAGFHHYEISNWSLPGCQARHNLGYWRNLPYLGVGPGAHSRLGAYRFWDISSPRKYLANVKKWVTSHPAAFQRLDEAALQSANPVDSWEHISPEIDCSEMMILGLRLLDGMDLVEASAQVGADLEAVYGQQIEELTVMGLLERNNGGLRLTSGAYLIANQVFTRFVG